MVLFFGSSILLKAQSNIYDLSIEDLEQIGIVPDTSGIVLQPTYELSIQDLMNLDIVKELHVDKFFDVDYDIPLSELLKLKINVKRARGITPSYEMSLKGLSHMELKEDVNIRDNIQVTYDISIEGIMKLKIEKVKKDE